MILVCSEDNDLCRVLWQSGHDFDLHESFEEAIEGAPRSSGLLLLADAYPRPEHHVKSELLDAAAAKNLRLYLEYPASIPGVELGEPQPTQWERTVVSSDFFAPALDRHSILALHGCWFLPAHAPSPHLVVAKVAGYRNAVYGLPEEAFPILFQLPGRDVMVATSKLSQFVTGRYGPRESWKALWGRLLGWLTEAEGIAGGRQGGHVSGHPPYGTKGDETGASPGGVPLERASIETTSPETASPGTASPQEASPQAASAHAASPHAAPLKTVSPQIASSQTFSPDRASLEESSTKTGERSAGLSWTPTVSPAFSREDSLPADTEAENVLAGFLCRIQVRSHTQRYLDGAWMRGLDYELWEHWGSSADLGWGAWSVESGWTNTWIASVLAKRHSGRTLFDLSRAGRLEEAFREILAEAPRGSGNSR